MKKRYFVLFLTLILLLSLLAGCGKKSSMLTVEEAQKIAVKEAGISESQISDIHTHISSRDGVPCYNIHITADGKEYEFFIDAATGEFLN